MKSIINRYRFHIGILAAFIIPLGWLIAPIIMWLKKHKQRKKIDEKLEDLRVKIVHHKPYFYGDYPTNFKKQLLSSWEDKKREIVNDMVSLGERYTTNRQSRLLRLITLRIYYLEIKI